MSRFLPFAAFAAAAGCPLAAAACAVYERARPTWKWKRPSDPSPSAAQPEPPATGHLALVRAHPGLRDLNALLTPGTFIVDATTAFLACALRVVPDHPRLIRRDMDYYSAEMVSAESDGDKLKAASFRFYLAHQYARDGRLEDALDAFALLAAEHPGFADDAPRIFAAALCYMLGRTEEGDQLLADGGPDLSQLGGKLLFMQAVKAATLGRTPHAAEGSRKLVMFSTLGLVEFALWSVFQDGNLTERLEALAFMVFLRRAVEKSLREGVDAQGRDLRTPSQTR